MLVAVDTGGTKTLITGFTDDVHIVHSLKFSTPAKSGDYARLLRDILEQNFSDQPVEAVVIALPGMVRGGTAVWCANLGWKNFNVAEALEGVLGGAPVLIANDANLGGLGEARLLGRTRGTLLYTTISTGIGTGIITDGKINEGMKDSEGGHCMVGYDGRLLEWEKFASGRAIHEEFGRFARDITSRRDWNNIAERIARGFLAVLPLIQPGVVVIGGSLGTYFSRYEVRLLHLIDSNLPPHLVRPHFIPAEHPEEAVIYGGYYYGRDYLAR